MGFITYYKSRYEEKSTFIWKLLIMLCSIALCIVRYPNIRRTFYKGGCAKDVITVFSHIYMFPLLVILCTELFLFLSYKDNNSNVVLRYGSRKRIWLYQCLAGVLYSLECVLIIYITALLFGYWFHGTYDNWQVPGSYFYTMMKNKNMPVDYGLSDFQIYLITLLIQWFIMALMMMVGLLLEYITGELRVAILGIVLSCGIDTVKGHFVIGTFEIKPLDYFNVSGCVTKILGALAAVVIVILIGIKISRYRQYYKKVE